MMKFSLSIVFICLIFQSNVVAGTSSTQFSQECFKIDPTSIGIEARDDGQIGPCGFRILDDKIAISNNKKIMVITREGKIIHSIELTDCVGHFDIDQLGNGYATTNQQLFRISNFKLVLKPLKVNFSLAGDTEGRLRIDLIPENKIRFISFSPDFIAIANEGKLNEAIVTSAEDNDVVSMITYNCSQFIGTYKNKYLFLDYGFNQKEEPYFRLKFYKTDGEKLINSKKYFISGLNFGKYIWWSYRFRMDERTDCFYAMFFKKNNIIIQKFYITKIINLLNMED